MASEEGQSLQQGALEADRREAAVHGPAPAPGKRCMYELTDGREGGQTRGWTKARASDRGLWVLRLPLPLIDISRALKLPLRG